MICVSLMADESEQIFMHLLSICISFFFILLFKSGSLFPMELFIIFSRVMGSVNQHPSALFYHVSCKYFFVHLVACFCLCDGFFFFFFASSSRHICPSIYLWFLGHLVALELSVSLSAGGSGLLSDWVTALSIPTQKRCPLKRSSKHGPLACSALEGLLPPLSRPTLRCIGFASPLTSSTF